MIERVNTQTRSPAERRDLQAQRCVLTVAEMSSVVGAQDLKTLEQIARSSSSERHRLRAAEVLLRTRVDLQKHEDDIACRKEERLRELGWTPNGQTGTTNNVLLAMGDEALRALSSGTPLEALLAPTTTGGGGPVCIDSPVLVPGDTTAGGREPRPEGHDGQAEGPPDLLIARPEVTAGPDPEPEQGTRAHVEWTKRQGGRNGHNFTHRDATGTCEACGERLDEEPHHCLANR